MAAKEPFPGATDRFAETAESVPMARGWRELARGHMRLAHFEAEDAGDEGPIEAMSEGVLPPSHPGVAFARWRGWVRGR